MGKRVTDYLLYRWRYIIGYVGIGIAIIALLLIAGLYIPGGLHQSEMNSVVASDKVSFTTIAQFQPMSVINLPYNLLQKASIELFGIENISIKLPSLLLAAASIYGMILLLLMWFRRNIAVLTTVLVITTGPFLYVAQSGTPSIVYVFLSVWILVAAMMISRHAKHLVFWKIILFGMAAISLYTPLSIYILLALASATALHPHLRYLVRQLLKRKNKVLLAIFCALLILAPLIYALFKDPSVGLILLGIPNEMPAFIDNSLKLINQYFGFTNPGSGAPMTPIYGLGTIILIILGVVRLFTTKYTARSYIISAWVLLLLPVLLINPNYSTITFVPAMLLMAMGINTLLRSWYQLFPRNPYARLAGLIPLVALIGGMFISGIDRYVYGYSYDPTTVNNFSYDLRLIHDQLDKSDRGETIVIVAKDEVDFYNVITKRYEGVKTVAAPAAATAQTMIISNRAHDTQPFTIPDEIVTDSRMINGDRFYIYKTDTE